MTTRVHGALDLASAAALFAVPRLMGWDGPVRRLADAAAVGTLGYAAVTDYEWGLWPILGMEGHRRMDAAQGLGFLAAALTMERAPLPARQAMAGYGLFALTAAAITEPVRRDSYAWLARQEEEQGFLMGEGI